MSEEATLDEFAEQGGDDNVPDEHPRFGSLPNDWKVNEISDIAEVVGGSTPSTSNDDYWGGGIPWATPTDITALSGNTISETEDTITEEGLESASTHLLPPNSVLMTSRATIGKCAINTVEMATNQGFKNLVPSDEVEHWYLYYRMLDTAAFLNSLGSGSTFDEVSKTEVQSVDIPIPPLSEQRKIATALYTVDRAVENAEGIIEKEKTVRRGTEQDLLTRGVLEDGSLRSEASTEYKSSWVGEVPKEWDVRPYSELISGSSVGIVVKPTQYYDDEGDVPILRSKDISRDGIVDGDFEYMTQESNEENSNSQLEAGDVITVRSGEPGLSCVVPSEFDGSNCADLLISTPGELLDPHFAAMWINSREGRKQIDRFQAGLAQKHFNLGALRKLKVAVPPIEEQRRIVERVSSITEAIDREKQYKTRLERLKRGLMQDLLSGKVRTTDTNIEVPEEVARHG